MKTMLITGASRGIGAEMVRRFTREGYQVAFCYCRSAEKALALAAETGAEALPCDVSDPAAVASMMAQFIARWKHLDALIVNAGIAWTGLTEEMPLADVDHLLSVNLRGAMLCVQAALPHLRESRGAVLLTSSMWGTVGASCESVYSATKAGLQCFARSLAKEVGPSGVRVNCIAPGCIETDMMAVYSDEEKQALAEDTPLGRLGTPQDIAAAAAFLMSPEASFITGQTLTVDGGFSL